MKEITIEDFSDGEILNAFYDRDLDHQIVCDIDSFSDYEIEEEAERRYLTIGDLDYGKDIATFLVENYKHSDFPLEIKRSIEQLSGKLFLS